jgi:hypothetical protein
MCVNDRVGAFDLIDAVILVEVDDLFGRSHSCSYSIPLDLHAPLTTDTVGIVR